MHNILEELDELEEVMSDMLVQQQNVEVCSSTYQYYCMALELTVHPGRV